MAAPTRSSAALATEATTLLSRPSPPSPPTPSSDDSLSTPNRLGPILEDRLSDLAPALKGPRTSLAVGWEASAIASCC